MPRNKTTEQRISNLCQSIAEVLDDPNCPELLRDEINDMMLNVGNSTNVMTVNFYSRAIFPAALAEICNAQLNQMAIAK